MFKRLLNLLKSHKASPSSPVRKTVPEFPAYICLETTNACNLRCIQCLYKGGTTEHYKRKIGFIDVDIAKRVIDELKMYGCGVMLNGDGETLLHPDFHTIAKYAVDKQLPSIYFNTNGTLLDKNFLDVFMGYFKGSVSISLDGFKESHERLRVGSSYDVVMANIDYFLEKRAKANCEIKLTVAYCNYDQPSWERDKFVSHWIEKVDGVTIGEVYDQNYKMISSQLNKPHDNSRIMCGVPWETFIVDWTGEVFPCSNCFSLGDEKRYVLGMLHNESLHDIWHGQKMNELRMQTEKWNLAGSMCETCDRWNMYSVFPEIKENGVVIRRTGVFTNYSKEC